MTSDDPVGHGSPGQGPVDPDFEGLFRPADVAAATALEPESSPLQDPTPDQAPDPAPAARDAVADTGRLFRSQGVSGNTEAVLAVESGRFGRLRTLERTTDEQPAAERTTGADDAPPSVPESPATPEDGDPQVAVLLGTEAAMPAEGDPMASTSRRGRRQRSTAAGLSGRGISGGAVSIVVIGVPLIVGLANALLGGGSLGWPTGLALLVSSTYAALTVRRDSDAIAFLMPPVAFLITALTAGQLFLDSNEGSLVNRAAIVFFTLAENWVWIIGSTLVALVIVLVRRRRG